MVAAAHADLDPDDLRELVEEGEFDEAYRLAETHRAELEGHALFDFYYGVAALASGHHGEGIFALERVIMQRPGFHRARLELARGYFLIGEDRRAREHFETVLAHEPPEPVQAAVERYLLRIQRRADRYSTVVTGHLELGAGYDSNVNSATDEETIELLGIPVELGDDSTELSDSFLRTAAGVRISRPLTPNTTVFGSGSAERRAYRDEDQFGTLSTRGRFGGIYHGELYRLSLGGRLQRFWLGGDRYQDMYGMDAGLHRSLSRRTAISAGAQLLRLEYEDQSHRDAVLGLGTVGLTRAWRWPLRPVANISLFGGKEDPRENSNQAAARTERDLYGIQGSLRLELDQEWILTTRAQYRESDYAEEDITFGETRKDDFVQLEIQLEGTPARQWRFGPLLRYSDNDSNIELFDYERTVAEMRVRYDFH